MIDWLTLRLPPDLCSDELRLSLARHHGKLVSINPDGTIEWEAPRRESVRSDSHQVTVHMGYGLEISGSPARVMQETNVFGSGCALNCFRSMVEFVSRKLDIQIPTHPEMWKVSRMDITHNYLLNSPAEVRQALSCLRLSEGGHLQVRTSAETVYWGAGSRLRRGKAYAKGLHMRYLIKKRQVEPLPDSDLSMLDRLLRLELTLAGQWWRERADKAWHQMNEQDFDQLHSEYFSKVVGSLEVREMDDLQQKFIDVAATPGRGKAAYRTWVLVKQIGVRQTQDMMPKATFANHKTIMFAAGLTWADLQSGNVVPFRMRSIAVGAPVRSWDELRRAA